MKKIVFLDQGTLSRFKLDFNFPYELTNIDNCPKDEVAKALEGHEIAITNKVVIDRAAMVANPQLKLIAVAATGYNVVDIAAAKELGIMVCNVAGYSTTAVAEHAFMMMISLMHRLPLYEPRMRDGEWQRSEFFSIFGAPIFELKGKTLGIFGKGSIGSQFAKYAQSFGMKVLFSERQNASEVREGYTPFEEVLTSSDVYSLHAPLTPETKDMISEAEIARMKDDVILLNVSRGGLINEAALAKALREGRVGGAGVDVLTTEPPKPDNPLLANDLGNFIITPHTAFASEEALDQLVALLMNNINQFVAGKPINIVN
ncbi:D-2-hydroxyacid dehydrogenase [Ignatzschineria rhizosphaerae]|uniref:D-2-hydroxyacid dehydrogenase n=1 Tax=Ignatzschineria rhizosphaerae TaxID=2923279 RepID=A0ABY3X280_9GAMM|nr:D-2-hydroxyacid dehydrogenase [Ignatzschineria rhizosphaerae]UNM95567.1 D-2-hydroxyacid dehydrogenase [Ignatzschineria rhizosphaerae]